jgi:hypothetical protein
VIDAQSDGKTEVMNKFLEGYLCCFPSDKQTQWVKWFPWAKWWYNKSFHTSSKTSPFLALYGYNPPYISLPLKGNTNVQVMEDHIGNQQEILKLLKNNLVMAKNKIKQQVDKHHSEREFEVGDWVFLRL